MVLLHSVTGANTLLAHIVVSLSAICAGGVFLPVTGTNTAPALKELALCGGGLCTWWELYVYVSVIVW